VHMSPVATQVVGIDDGVKLGVRDGLGLGIDDGCELGFELP